MSEELKALETVRADLDKLIEKYKVKSDKERTKINDVYVLVHGQKCYTENEINEWLEGDYITAKQSDKLIERLEAKQRKAGENGGETKSERAKRILQNLSNQISLEIRDINNREEQKRKKEERWEIAKAQGLTYAQWLELEEVSQRSEEYEILMGLKD